MDQGDAAQARSRGRYLMFTGIVESLGRLARREVIGGDAQLTIACPDLSLEDVRLGDSIAVNGVCLTVTGLSPASFDADMSVETLARTCLGELAVGSDLNLEKALMPTSRMGGHIVTGHVDGVGEVLECEPRGRAIYYSVAAAKELLRYIAPKGSIAVDGVSLTINGVWDDRFELLVIPHTLSATTLPSYAPGRHVHLEVDIMARYAERLLQGRRTREPRGLTLEQLAEAGFLR